MRHRQAFQNDIFCKFDLDNDLLTMTLTYNHFKNKFNQLRHPKNPTIDTRTVKIGPWTPKICHFRFTVGGHLGFGRKKRVKGVEKFEPYDFLVIWSLMMQYPPLIQFGQTNLANSIFVTSQPPLVLQYVLVTTSQSFVNHHSVDDMSTNSRHVSIH